MINKDSNDDTNLEIQTYLRTQRNIIKKLFIDTAAYLPAKIVSAVGGIISIAIFTRIFNPREYGIYVLIITTTSILTAIFSQWIIQSILRYRATYLNNKEEYLFNKNLLIILILLTIAIFAIGLSLFAFIRISEDYNRYLMLSLFIIIAGIISDSMLALLQSDLKASVFTMYTVIGVVVRVIIPILFVSLLKKDVIFLLYGVLANSIVIFPMLCSICYRTLFLKLNTKQKSDSVQFFAFLKRFYYYGFPMIGWFIGAEILNICDRYFIQFFKGSEQVGIYSANYNLVASSLAFIAFPLLTAAHPLLMKLGSEQNNNKERIQNLISEFSRYFLIVAVPIVLYLLCMSEDLTTLFLGVEFRKGRIIFPFILTGSLTWNLAMLGHKGLELQDKTRTMFLYVVICAVIKILLNFVFIPPLGYLGAAITTLIAYSTYPLLVYFGSKNGIRWNISFISLYRITIASVIAAGLAFLLRNIFLNLFVNLFVGGIIMTVCYGLLLYIIGELKRSEINYLKSWFNDIGLSKKTNI